MAKLILTVVILVALTSIQIAVAEDTNSNQQGGPSAVSSDKRLPPVIPGEEIHSGDKVIKVWSTAGSVGSASATVNQPPAPTQAGASGIGPIIVQVEPQRSDVGSRPMTK